LNEHLIRKASEEKLLKSRNKVRVDTTVVEADIHHPTDSGSGSRHGAGGDTPGETSSGRFEWRRSCRPGPHAQH